MIRSVGLVLLAGLSALASLSASPALGAGRVPYGGSAVLPVADMSGLRDPHQVNRGSARTVARLVHCRLFRPTGSGSGSGLDYIPELAAALDYEVASGDGTEAPDAAAPARDGGAVAGRWRHQEVPRRRVRLRPGARFHDGRPVTAADVVASFKRLARLGTRSPLGRLFGALEFRAIDAQLLEISMPADADPDEVRALLARPEAGVLRGGRPGRGRACGPFFPASGAGDSRVLKAFRGHPEGRPWLDTIVLKRVAPASVGGGFDFGALDLAYESPRRAAERRRARAVQGGQASWLVVFPPRLRGPEGRDFRRAVMALTARVKLGRYVRDPSRAAQGPWPKSLSPSEASPSRPKNLSQLPNLPNLVVAFADGDEEATALARAVRDGLRPLAHGGARAVPVAGLTPRVAARQERPAWDLALVRLEWAALTPAQAAEELAWTLGLTANQPSGAAILAGASKTSRGSRSVRAWAAAVTRDVTVAALLHLSRPVWVREGLVLQEAGGGTPDLATGYRP